MKTHQLFFVILLTLTVKNSIAQVKNNSDLFILLKKADSLTFNEGFNKCNYAALKKVLHQDLEFFHDDGAANLEQFYSDFSKNICGNSNYKPIRKLLLETLEVYPLKNNGKLYGAIQKGEHNFYIKEQTRALYNRLC